MDPAVLEKSVDQRRIPNIEELGALLKRLYMAVFGGFALIVPMIIVAFPPDESHCPCDNFGFRALRCGYAAFFMKDSSEKDILAATAAYVRSGRLCGDECNSYWEWVAEYDSVCIG